jgi:PTS system nitrogen regulatory IIA component
LKLTVRDAAALLAVSEKTIYRWVRSGALPAYRLSDQYRFNRAELLEWGTARRINFSPDIFSEPESEIAALPTVAAALAAGGIHYRVGGTTKNDVLRAAVQVLPLPPEVDRDYLLSVLIAREALGSSAVGEGVAIPHVRNPVVLHVDHPLLALCLLDHATDWGALDGVPVRTLFVLLAPTVRAHLHLLARVSHLLRDPRFRAALEAGASREVLGATVDELEAGIPPATAAGAGPAPSRP